MKTGSINNLSFEKALHGEYMKQVIVRDGEVPNLFQIGRVVIKKGQIAFMHGHDERSEIQIVEKGRALFKSKDGKEQTLEEGSFAITNSDEAHELSNPFDEDLILLFLEIKS